MLNIVSIKRAYLLICLFVATNIAMASARKQSYPDSIVTKRMWIAGGSQAAFYVGGMSFLQWVWYKDHQRTPFHFYNDNKGYLQMDKAGHAYSAYYESSISYHLFRWAGMSKKKALWLGGPMGLILQTPIEIFDGIYEGYGFSKGDMVANFSDSLLFTVQQAVFDQQIVKIKFSYSPSAYRKYHPFLLGETHLESFFTDYNGHTYWLSTSVNRFHKKIPEWLCLSAGYSANGMIGEFENRTHYKGTPIPHLERYRQYLLSLDVDLSKIKTKSKVLQKIFKGFGSLKIPAPALEYNRINGFKFRSLYY